MLCLHHDPDTQPLPHRPSHPPVHPPHSPALGTHPLAPSHLLAEGTKKKDTETALSARPSCFILHCCPPCTGSHPRPPHRWPLGRALPLWLVPPIPPWHRYPPRTHQQPQHRPQLVQASLRLQVFPTRCGHTGRDSGTTMALCVTLPCPLALPQHSLAHPAPPSSLLDARTANTAQHMPQSGPCHPGHPTGTHSGHTPTLRPRTAGWLQPPAATCGLRHRGCPRRHHSVLAPAGSHSGTANPPAPPWWESIFYVPQGVTAPAAVLLHPSHCQLCGTHPAGFQS